MTIETKNIRIFADVLEYLMMNDVQENLYQQISIDNYYRQV